MHKTLLILVVLPFLAGITQAETTTLDTVVVTATRTETPLSQIGSSVTVITAEEIEEKQQTQVLDVLRSVPGINLYRYGNLGSTTSISLRGTSNTHTLVLIDGVEFRDAAGFGGANLAHLTTDNIERIEIVRGAQSVLYGSDAIGGVINIITKKGAKKSQGYVSLEGGSYNTWTEEAGFSAGSEKVTTSFSVSRTDSDGFSAANEKDGNTEEDGDKSTSASFSLGVTPTNIFELKLNVRLTDAEYEYDNYAPPTYLFSDADDVEDYKDITGRTEGIFHLCDDKLTISVGASITDTERETEGSVFGADSTYDGKITKFDLQNTIKLNEKNTLIVGAETEKEEYKSNSMSYSTYTNVDNSGSTRNNAAYIQEHINIENFSATTGIRIDDHKDFGTEATWRIAPSYNIKSTSTHIKASVGTGFKAPTLYELNDSSYGNEDLDAEKSFSWDIGIEQTILRSSLILSATYFFSDIDDYIAGDSETFISYNIAELKSQGIETTIDWYPHEIVSLSLNYTYTDTEDEDGERKARIPLHKSSFDVNLYPIDDVQLTTSVLYVGEREDSGETLDAYTLVNLSGSYQVCDYAKLFARIENLFDEDYEEVAGYGTAGLSAYAGVKVTF
jgi:vitamin B12 transporter